MFDEATMTAAIRETGSGKLWQTLPSEHQQGAAIEVELSNGGDTVYTLNSQDNSVAFGNASYTVSGDGVSVKYAIAQDAATGSADISTLEDSQPRVDLTVLYTLRDGSFYVNVSMNTLTLPQGVYLEKIKVLNGFGAYGESGAEDYIFIPDGSGALIMTGIEDSDFSSVTLPVYGNDAATDNGFMSSCLVGAFGIKHGESAFLCIIEQGDTIAEITADRADENTLNQVGASFKTTDIFIEQGKKLKKTYGNQYKNEIRLCYRFLSGKSATYNGMATACRENLIRNSVLSTKSVETNEKNIPLTVALHGGYIDTKGKYTVLSDYSQAQSLMALLKAKGVNNVYLNYRGLFKNANNGKADGFGSFRSSFKKSKDYDALYEYIKSQNFSLFIDTDILTFDYTPSHCAENLKGLKITYKYEGDGSQLGTTAKLGYAKISHLEKKVENILYYSESLGFDGFSLNDIGEYLYSDYSSGYYSRESAKREITAQIPVIATSKKLMIESGNLYSVKNADMVTEIPMSPAVKTENSAYVGVPFIQMMLHGITEYSASGVNISDDTKTAFLKSVEYGCLPAVEWYCSQYNEALDEKYCYDKNINDMVSYYIKANEIFSDLRDARMTAHYSVQSGFFCTEYNNSTKVYVNFTDSPVTVNGITVGAQDCVKIS